MKAAGFNSFGGPEEIETIELPDPEPGVGEVRVRVAAATINPSDVAFREGGYGKLADHLDPPYVSGWEFAGVVDALGTGVEWSEGDEVCGVDDWLGDGRGGLAEYIVVTQDQLARKPRDASLVEAATLPMNGLTVRQAYDKLDLREGATVVVTGAAGAVGGYAVQLGKVMGLTVVAIAGADDEPLLETLGADVFVARGDDASQRAREAAGGEGADGVIDAALLHAAALPALRDGGALASVRPFEGEAERGIRTEQVWVGGYVHEQEKLAALVDLVEQDRLTLRVSETFPLDQAREAYERFEAGGVRGRVLVTF